MKIYKIIIAPIALLLLIMLASHSTIYSEGLIGFIGWPDDPDIIEKIYGEFDVEIIASKYNQYYAYKLDEISPNGKEQYFVCHYTSTPADEVRIKFYTYEGTDWIEEVTPK